MSDPFEDPAPSTGKTQPSMTLSEFLARFDEVETAVDGYVVTCPHHEDTKPSLRVGYNDKERKLALHCRAGCNTPDVVASMGLSLADLFDVEPGELADVRTSGDAAGPINDADRRALAAYLERASIRAAAGDTDEFLQYANRRFGITSEKFSELGLGYDDGNVAGGSLVLSRALYHDAPRLVVPFYGFDGKPHYLQARSLVDGVKAKWSGPNNPEGRAWGKYGYFQGGSGWSEVIITEGPGDALTVAAVGYDVVLIRGAGLGTNPDLVDELAVGLAGRRVIVAGDADNAGIKFTRDVADALSKRAIDVHNARTLLAIIQEQGGDVRYTDAAGWIVYRPDAGTWELDWAEWVRTQAQEVAPRVQRAILDSMQSMDARVAAMDDKDLRDVTGKLLDAQRRKARSGSLVSYVMSTRGIDAMLRELRALPGVPTSYEDFDKHPELLAVGNGVVELETGTLRPYTPETKDLLLLRRIDVSYHPGARNPRWEKFLEEVFDKYPDLPGYIQRLIGYGITGHTTEQALAVFYGGGSNGKGVLIETLTGLFKGITTTTPFSTFEMKPSGGIPNDIAALKGSRLVMASEGEQGRQMAESLIKRLTGGDTISARFMRKEFFEFTPTFLILLATNYKPNFRGQDFGLWRRVKLVPFDRTFGEEDKDRYLTAKFLGKRVPASAYRTGEDFGDGPEGILAWAIRGAVLWSQEGLHDPAVITRATAEFKETSDALAEFYAEHLTKDPRGKITGQAVWKLYQDWTDEENLDKKDVWKRSTFWKALEERGAVKTLPSGIVTFKGIRPKRPSDRAADPVGDEVEALIHGAEEARADQADFADVDNTEAPVIEPFTL